MSDDPFDTALKAGILVVVIATVLAILVSVGVVK